MGAATVRRTLLILLLGYPMAALRPISRYSDEGSQFPVGDPDNRRMRLRDAASVRQPAVRRELSRRVILRVRQLDDRLHLPLLTSLPPTGGVPQKSGGSPASHGTCPDEAPADAAPGPGHRLGVVVGAERDHHLAGRRAHRLAARVARDGVLVELGRTARDHRARPGQVPDAARRTSQASASTSGVRDVKFRQRWHWSGRQPV